MKMNKPVKLTDDIELTPDSYAAVGINWYPGHMAKAVREIKQKLQTVDIVFEIRDARAPLASGNRNLEDTLRQKSRLIILNKVNSPALIWLLNGKLGLKNKAHLLSSLIVSIKVR